jgi:hypothetical protein
MESGQKTILILLIVAAMLGVIVLVWNPDYRDASLAILKGEPQNSPIWRSNEAYYDAVDLEALNAREDATDAE